MQYQLLPKNELFGFIGHANIGLDTLIVSIEWFSTELWKKKFQVANSVNNFHNTHNAILFAN